MDQQNSDALDKVVASFPFRKPIPRGEINYTASRTGAHQLAKNFEKWWHDRGFTQVKTTIERHSAGLSTERNALFCVRSNLKMKVSEALKGNIIR